jgi:hypothetical protein
MLRRPGESPITPREEGCSSTAFATVEFDVNGVWANPAGRGSPLTSNSTVAAVP